MKIDLRDKKLPKSIYIGGSKISSKEMDDTLLAVKCQVSKFKEMLTIPELACELDEERNTENTVKVETA